MKKDIKKILAVTVLGLFVFVLALQFVSAANPIRDMFANWQSGENFSANIAKYLLWALVAMLIYGVSDKFPGLDGKEYIKVPFSLIIGFLSMAYLTPKDVISLMTSYSALGFTLGAIIPFLILTFFTFDLASKEGNASEKVMYSMIATVMWAAFSVFLVYKAIYVPEGGSKFLVWILALIAILLTVTIRPIMHYIKGEVHQAKKDTFKEASDLIAEGKVADLRQARRVIKAAEE